jgi:acyl carrier protein
MTRENIRAACVKAVVDVSGNTPQTITDDAKLGDDLGMDELDIVETLLEIENSLGVAINEGDPKTFGDLMAVACAAKGVA